MVEQLTSTGADVNSVGEVSVFIQLYYGNKEFAWAKTGVYRTKSK